MKANLGISLVLIALTVIAQIGALDLGPLRANDNQLEQVQSDKLALLVGCTSYPENSRIAELNGPANDIPMFVDLLTNPDWGFGFKEENTKVLLGWPDTPEDRPTSENIAHGFTRLIDKAKSGSQVFIVLAGHGVQIPIPESQDPFDPANPEPDGMDEVFLPADVGEWNSEGLAGAIRDDQIGAWLDALKEKKCHVWIVFDCCHSGCMSRGADDVEVFRSVAPQDLGIPDAAIEKAVKKARAGAAGHANKKIQASASDILQLSTANGTGGTVAAFYAAQPWEKAPELPRPRDAPRTKDHYYGLFSYTINQCLRDRKTPLSYRDLGKLVVAKYRADRGSRGPTPCVEGDLDLEVLGAIARPAPKILLECKGNEMKLGCGELAGITLGSVLAVRPLNDTEEETDQPIGYVKVTEVTPFGANVRPCPFGERARLPVETFPMRGQCELVSRDLGDLRVKIALAAPPPSAPLDLTEVTKNLRSELGHLPNGIDSLIDAGVTEENAEWILQVVDSSYAESYFGMKTTEPRVLLFQGRGGKSPRGVVGRQGAPTASGREKDSERIFGNYSAMDMDSLSADLARDLAKIFSWNNIWRVADCLSDDNEYQNHSGLVFEVRCGEQAGAPAKPLANATLHIGQIVEYHFRNDGIEDLWIAAAYLDGNYGIHLFHQDSFPLRAGTSLRPMRAVITGDSLGVEGVVAFAVPMTESRPDFSFLEQGPLGVMDPRTRDVPDGDETPFEMLMRAAAGKAPGTRGQMLMLESSPAVVGHSWITVSNE